MPLSPRAYDAGAPVPSPDGRRVLFHALRDGAFDIHVVALGDAAPMRLTGTPSHEYLPSWAPGDRITFVSRGLIPGDTLEDAWIWIMDADGGDQRRLVPEGLGTSAGAVWAPGGRYFLTSRARDGGGTTLWRVAADGRWLAPVADGLESPAFSPDGAWIAAHAEEGAGSRIVVMRPDGSDRRTVIRGGWHAYPRWSPDGRWLLTCSAVDGAATDLDVLFLRADGSAAPETLVSGPDRECEASWLTAG